MSIQKFFNSPTARVLSLAALATASACSSNDVNTDNDGASNLLSWPVVDLSDDGTVPVATITPVNIPTQAERDCAEALNGTDVRVLNEHSPELTEFGDEGQHILDGNLVGNVQIDVPLHVNGVITTCSNVTPNEDLTVRDGAGSQVRIARDTNEPNDITVKLSGPAGDDFSTENFNKFEGTSLGSDFDVVTQESISVDENAAHGSYRSRFIDVGLGGNNTHYDGERVNTTAPGDNSTVNASESAIHTIASKGSRTTAPYINVGTGLEGVKLNATGENGIIEAGTLGRCTDAFATGSVTVEGTVGPGAYYGATPVVSVNGETLSSIQQNLSSLTAGGTCFDHTPN